MRSRTSTTALIYIYVEPSHGTVISIQVEPRMPSLSRHDAGVSYEQLGKERYSELSNKIPPRTVLQHQHDVR